MVSFSTLFGYKKKPSKPSTSSTPSNASNASSPSEYEKMHAAKQRREDWHGDRRLLRRIEADEKDKRHWRRYCNNRSYQYSRLKKSIAAVGRLEATLRRNRDCTIAYSRSDCDIDIAGVVESLKLSASIPESRDRWLVYETIRDWISDLAKEQGTYKFDDCGPFFVPSETVTTLDEVKAALELR